MTAANQVFGTVVVDALVLILAVCAAVLVVTFTVRRIRRGGRRPD